MNPDGFTNHNDRSEPDPMPFLRSQTTMDQLLKQVCIPPDYLHIGDSLSRDTAELPLRLERWRVEVVATLRDLASHLAISGRPSTEKQALLVIHIAQYIGTDPWVSSDALSHAEGACLSYPQCLG